MKIFVKAIPGSYKESVERIDQNHFKITVKQPPIKGLANNAIISALSRFLKVPKSNIFLVSGFSSSQKVFEVYF